MADESKQGKVANTDASQGGGWNPPIRVGGTSKTSQTVGTEEPTEADIKNAQVPVNTKEDK